MYICFWYDCSYSLSYICCSCSSCWCMYCWPSYRYFQVLRLHWPLCPRSAVNHHFCGNHVCCICLIFLDILLIILSLPVLIFTKLYLVKPTMIPSFCCPLYGLMILIVLLSYSLNHWMSCCFGLDSSIYSSSLAVILVCSTCNSSSLCFIVNNSKVLVSLFSFTINYVFIICFF